MGKQAEIAGGGLGGLALAVLLARRGWSVTVHERSPQIREIGAGIFLHNNGLFVIEELGLMPALEAVGVALQRRRMVDERGRPMQDRPLGDKSRAWSVSRQDLLEILHRDAISNGVNIRTSSEITGASPVGTLTAADGTVFGADLVVGADGHRSAVRRSLDIRVVERQLPTTSIRFLVPGRDFCPEPGTTEHWSGRRRVALAACGPANTYVYMACPNRDTAGSTVPIDVSSWEGSFPRLRGLFGTLRTLTAHKSSYSYVRAQPWSAGSVVLVGDAAHALAPTLGQGTNLTLSNCRSLVTYLEAAPSVPAALAAWEDDVRGVTDITQAWSGRYDRLTKYWPPRLAPVRGAIIWTFGTSQSLNRRLRVADETLPVVRAERLNHNPGKHPGQLLR